MKSYLVKKNLTVWRILDSVDDKLLVVNCFNKAMPILKPAVDFNDAEVVDESELPKIRSIDDLSPEERKIAIQRYTTIAAVLSVLSDTNKRNLAITQAANQWKISKQTIRSYLYQYLVYQDISALAPKEREVKELTSDEKNFRWALNKYFYTRNKNSLKTAYTMMLKARYCESDGQLKDAYPTFNQFRYFYNKTRKLENYYISREGLTEYQKNKRPLIGNGAQEFAPNIGTAMLDGTVCDIYLVDDSGQLIGRPILVAACDANTSLCIGYALLLEGGTYSLQQLMLNIISDKLELCNKMGIMISKEQWPVADMLPGIIVTDRGKEYCGQTFEQISELGVTIINLPPYRPDLKGPIEKLFSLIQDSYKDILKGSGVIMPDFQERGAKDYRKEACLTLESFEKIIVKCIVYYNCYRIIESYPYSTEMLDLKIKPYACDIWNYKINTPGVNLIPVSKNELILHLLPRVSGKFSRHGLIVNKLNYYADGYKEQYLSGKVVTVAYNPDNCNAVWLIESDGSFVEFRIIETRFSGLDLTTVENIKSQQKEIVTEEHEENLKAKIDLINFIEAVSNQNKKEEPKTKNIKKARSTAVQRNHKKTEV